MQKAEAGGFASQEEVNQAEMELAQLEQKITQLQESEAQRQAELAAEIQKDFFTRVQEYLKRFSAENNIDVVLNVQQGGSVLYSKETMDITSQVTAGLNAEYEAEQNAVTQE
jgi:Skp family chaperone for outer membrane proteins